MTHADVALLDVMSTHRDVFPDKLEAYPHLLAFTDHVTALPGIAEYLASPQRNPPANWQYLCEVNASLGRPPPVKASAH